MMPQRISAYIPSRGIRRIPDLAAFLPEYRIHKHDRNAEAVIGWGLRPSTVKPRALALAKNLPFIALEDGFVRSLGLGVTGAPPLAMVYDDVGIYYDTTRPSRLENLILQAPPLSAAQQNDVREAIAFICAQHISKYNHAPDFSEEISKKTILVIDQTFGDMALRYGGADENTFRQMFQTALAENPDADIWVKTHPDVLCGKKKGYLTQIAQSNRVRLFADDVNPISLLKRVDSVYCVTSQMGFEALLCGKKVVTFGLPWYAGWGVSDDRHSNVSVLQQQARRRPCGLADLFYSAYFQYSRYLNPNTGEQGTLFDVLRYLAMARNANEKLRGQLYCVGMSLWKRAVMQPFFNLPSCRLKYVSSLKQLEKQVFTADARILAWGNGKNGLIAFAEKHHLPVLRMEDGFIRSVGLGSNLVPPLSLVIDDMGIYFNPNQVSRLEYILQHQPFDAQMLQTASELQTELTLNNISKYNVGNTDFTRPDTNKRILLVPGQVEDDASIRSGSPKIYRNLDLLRTVRERNPDAFIIYKPHPDVVSGNRIGAISQADTDRLADCVAAEADILSCLQYADEVHTMTSLTGFEALLRGKKVYCYGLPFYAGWGLTVDELNLARRTRRLSLEELIAGTLVSYPTYIHPESRRLIDAAGAIDVLKQQKRVLKNNNGLKRSWAAKQIGKIRQLSLSLRK